MMGITMKPILEAKDIVKDYPEVRAVNGLSLSIMPGSCFGLLGPNGAGKTTTIEIIEGIVNPTSGTILYKGSERGANFKEEIGIQFQATALFDFLTVGESLKTFHGLYKYPMAIDELISLCYLEEILDRKNNKISGGQKQRLLLAMALVNDPDLVFLDEPTTGLDPQARRHVWKIVENIRAKGKTVILTTHYMEEAQSLCDEIAIIDKGKIVIKGSPEYLLNSQGVEVTISLPIENMTNDLKTAFKQSSLSESDYSITMGETRCKILTTKVEECMGLFLATRTDLCKMTVRTKNMEDLFLELTGYNLRQ